MPKADAGFALAQVIFLIGLTSALSITIYRVNQQTVKQSKVVNQNTSIDLSARKMLTYLRSTAACMNTIAPIGTWDTNGNGSLDQPAGPRGETAAYDESLINPAIILNIRDAANTVVYEACGAIDTANLANNNRCLVQTSGGGNIYLKEIRLLNLTPDDSPPYVEINFNYVLLNRFYNETTSAYVWEEQAIASRALLAIQYDDTTHEITRCAFTEGRDLTDGCDSIRGEMNDATASCKGPSVGFPAFEAGNYGLKVRGNFRTTRRMSAQSLTVGAPEATFPLAGQPGNLFVTGGVQYGNTSGSISVGDNANAAVGSMTVSGSVRGAFDVGITTVGDLRLVEPAGAVNDQRRWLVTDGNMTLLNFPNTLDLTGESDNRVVTTGWVRRAIARSLTNNATDANTIFNGLIDQLQTEESSIEENILRRFCDGARIRGVSAVGGAPGIAGSFLTWVNGVRTLSAGRTLCQLSPTFMTNAQMCNANVAGSPRCNQVHATYICLGTGADRSCRTTWPTFAVTGECSAPTVITRDAIGGLVVAPFQEYICPPTRVFVNTSSCCAWRAK